MGRIGFALASLMAFVVLGAAAAAAPAPGRIAGLTQISFGCPGPVREGEQCEHWAPFGPARFAVSRESSGGVVAGTRRVVFSDAHGRLSVSLAPGSYRLAPLPAAHTMGGPLVHVRVRAGATTSVLVRYEGYPKML